MRRSCSRKLFLGVGAFAWLFYFAPLARGAELTALYADGQRENFPVVVYEGVEHLSLKNLERLLLKVDEGAQIERQYYSNELRITIRGKSITISDEYMVVAGTVFRPQNTMRTISGEMLIPVETLQEMNSALGLATIERPGAQATPLATPSLTPTPLAMPTPPSGALQPLPENLIATPPENFFGPLPMLEPAVGVEPLIVPDTSEQSSLNTLLGDVTLPNFSRIAVVAFSADRKTYGENADIASAIADRAAQRLRESLLAAGNFTVLVPDSPWSSQSVNQTVDWVNSQQCDALITLTVDSTPIQSPQGVRIMIAHEAADASAREATALGPGLPQRLNYVPYEQKSVQMASFLREEIAKGSSATVQEVELAPLYVLRRVAMPSVEISLGSVSSDDERDRMAHGRFTDEIGSAMAQALVRMQQALNEGLL